MPSRNLVRHHGERGAHGPNGGQLYAGIPMELARDGKLSYTARSVAMYVWSHDEQWQQSVVAVAESLGMKRDTVAKALAELQERGWMAREIHQTVGKSGKPRVVWERWHLQMTNRRFTPDEVRELSTVTHVPTKRARSTQTCPPNGHVRAHQTGTGGAHETGTIEMQSRNAPEVHSSNAKTDQDETGHESRSLAVAGTEATAEDRPANRRQADPELETASADATEASEEDRPTGLQSLGRLPAFDDPFASEPGWLAEAAATAAAEDERAAHLPVSASAVPDPWSS